MSAEYLNISRKTGGYRSDRLSDFGEVEMHLPLSDIMVQASRCMGCGIPFCHGYGCPLANDIPGFNLAVKEGRLADAYKILSTTSPFPEFTARVCPATCEASCCSGLLSDAVSIRQIEYAIIENAFLNGIVERDKPKFRTGRRVAVIGSGPSGLAAADCLNKLGHEVVVFEKNSSLGGLLRYGIPDFKLAKSVIERRIDVMGEQGVFFEPGVEIGTDISAEYLRRKFDAVCLCIGSEEPRDLPVEGRSLGGVHFALEFLSSQNRANSGEAAGVKISAKGKKVLIIGGGDTGSDCLGTALRQGAKEVLQVEIMPQPPKERSPSTPWPEWPYMLRTSSSHLEGGKRMWGVSVKKIFGRNGVVKGVEAVLLDWQFDASGRPKRPVERENSLFKLEADLILLAMGFTGVKKKGLVEELGLEIAPRGMIAANASCATNMDSVFACGDCVSGPSLVSRSMAAGKFAASNIDCRLKKLL